MAGTKAPKPPPGFDVDAELALVATAERDARIAREIDGDAPTADFHDEHARLLRALYERRLAGEPDDDEQAAIREFRVLHRGVREFLRAEELSLHDALAKARRKRADGPEAQAAQEAIAKFEAKHPGFMNAAWRRNGR